jgi:ABC-2 type transport system permease protein
MLVGLFALAIGAIVRNTAGGISLFAALFFVIPPLLLLLPSSWQDAIIPYLPSEAGRAIFSLTHSSGSLAPGPGLALFAGYTLLALAVAAVLLVRRDT